MLPTSSVLLPLCRDHPRPCGAYSGSSGRISGLSGPSPGSRGVRWPRRVKRFPSGSSPGGRGIRSAERDQPWRTGHLRWPERTSQAYSFRVLTWVIPGRPGRARSGSWMWKLPQDHPRFLIDVPGVIPGRPGRANQTRICDAAGGGPPAERAYLFVQTLCATARGSSLSVWGVPVRLRAMEVGRGEIPGRAGGVPALLVGLSM